MKGPHTNTQSIHIKKSPNLDFLITDFLSFQRHVTASRFKNTPAATKQNISISVDGILSLTMWPVWGWLPCLRLPRLGTGSAKKGLLSRGNERRRGRRNHFPAHYFNQQWQLRAEDYPPDRAEVRKFYLQNECCDVWSVRAQIWYWIQFIVVQLSVHIERKKRVRHLQDNPVFTPESAENIKAYLHFT